MDLFPYTLARIGGDTFDRWQQIQFPKTNKALNELIELKREVKRRKESLCKELLQHIRSLQDNSVQNNIQNVRRNVFNDRRVKDKELNKIRAHLPIDLLNELTEYLKKAQEISSKNSSYEDIFDKELSSKREELKEIIQSEVLQKGLLLSSKSLLSQSENYISKPVGAFRKKEFQTERSLLQYLSRIYTKTSPFSTFTNLAIVNFNGIEGQHGQHINKSKRVETHIRLNNLLLKYLLDLFKNYRDLYIHLPLRINPTITLENESFVYLTNNNNVESFQRIPQNPVIDFMLEEISNYKEGMIFGELRNKMAEAVDASQEEIENYIKQLLDVGFLEYNFRVSGIDPDWDKKLITVLQFELGSKVPILTELIEELKKIRHLGNDYAIAKLDDRKRILNEAFDSFSGICMKIHKKAGLPEVERESEKERLEKWKANKKKATGNQEETDASKASDKQEVFIHKSYTSFHFKPEQIFYEDTTRNSSISINQSSCEEIIAKLSELLNHLRLFQGHVREKEKMKEYFLQKINSSKSDILHFYEAYYRDIKKPEKEAEEKESNESVNGLPENPGNKKYQNTSNSSQRDLIQKWQSEIKKVIDLSGDSIDIDVNHLQKLNSKIDFKNTDVTKNSYGSFLQFFEEDGQMKAVVNSTFSGYGKMISRFLHIFDEEVTRTVRRWNMDLSENTIFAEDCDSSYFNANLHPPLMPYEVRIPGGHNSLESENQIPITDLEIKYDKKEDRLKLVSKTKEKEVNVFDLGFQGHLGRSQLFLLLEKFTYAEHLSPSGLTHAINSEIALKHKEGTNKHDKVLVFPRIVFDKKLILQRKTWTVKKEALPFKENNESEWEGYRKVNEWRLKLDLPAEVFVFINPAKWGRPTAKEKEAMKRLTKDDYKPQYINFNSPFMVCLFLKLIKRVPSSMKITEMLPNSNQLLKIDNERYVSEFMVQWYNYDRS